MPKQALYNIDNILSQSVDIFLENGYHGASMDEIIARTGFNRRAFYQQFTSKQGFLYQVVEHYMSCELLPVVSELESHQGVTAINRFFMRYIPLIYPRGCLLINMITELSKQDAKIYEYGRHYLDRLQFDFIGCLEKALAMNEISTTVSIESIALQLTHYVQGMAVSATLAESKHELIVATTSLLMPLQQQPSIG